MAKQKARALLVKIGDGATPEVFATLCGLTTKSITVNNNPVDVTTANKTTPEGQLWQEMITGMRSITISGNGLFEDDASETTFHSAAFGTGQTDTTDAVNNFQVIVPDFGTFEGSFHINNVEYGGPDLEGAVSYSFELASAGVVTWTAA